MYDTIISLTNIHQAWREFVSDKRYKNDVAEYALQLSKNIASLHDDLKNKTYVHSGYKAFAINDPKPRSIHKAVVRDRLLHHVIYRILYPYFDKKFIYDSYSCRNDKGTHIEINLSFVRIREQAKKINALERRGTRPGAKALDETVNGPRSERYARPSDIPRKFRVVDER